MNDTADCRIREAALRVEQLMRREFGLSPTRSAAELSGSIFRVTLRNALSPLGRAISRAEGGTLALDSVYKLLHDVHQGELHCLVSCLLNSPVQSSTLQADFFTADVFVTFYLASRPPADSRHSVGASPDMAHSCLK